MIIRAPFRHLRAAMKLATWNVRVSALLLGFSLRNGSQGVVAYFRMTLPEGNADFATR